MAQLEGAGEGEDEGDVLLLVWFLADDLDDRGGAGGQAACEGRVEVDEELEEVEEGVGNHGDRAVELALVAVAELEGLFGLFADGEGDPFDFVVRVLDVLACFPAGRGGEVLAEVRHRGTTQRVRARVEAAMSSNNFRGARLTSCDSYTRRGWVRRSGTKGGHLRRSRRRAEPSRERSPAGNAQGTPWWCVFVGLWSDGVLQTTPRRGKGRKWVPSRSTGGALP
ncbi:hypothetical protein CTA1_11923 [Colletotrichum tanaceti]|uniref:Uncharacterized protein n=1 Tax=Colletotrichum tanaceti TaxID=1306861 RepID=A0A4V6DHD5_9PEZI|nr:hypothetical protein CTA1_11923 [Colletotrichum tanaceti]